MIENLQQFIDTLKAQLAKVRNQLEGKTQAFETLQKAHASLVDQLKESRRAEGALATALRKAQDYWEMWVESELGGTSIFEDAMQEAKANRAALKLTDL